MISGKDRSTSDPIMRLVLFQKWYRRRHRLWERAGRMESKEMSRMAGGFYVLIA